MLIILNIKINELSQASEAHACISSYSGGRDKEDRGLKPAHTNILRDSISQKKKKNGCK
jgi:hypothetical protein